jgi:multidrug efflux pump subunit AcrA (membrane-fusion protein)
MVGKIQLQTQAVEGIIIPATCIHTQTHSTMVWVVHNGKAMRRQIEVGPYTADGVLVSSGLSVGDVIITSGYQKMYNGAPVTY